LFLLVVVIFIICVIVNTRKEISAIIAEAALLTQGF
jgi:hypothetical protein